jgi:hypothetical protein
VDSDPAVRLFVREVRPGSSGQDGEPVLLVHGARVPGLASFDLPVAGGSFAADLARLGFDVYVMGCAWIWQVHQAEGNGRAPEFACAARALG